MTRAKPVKRSAERSTSSTSAPKLLPAERGDEIRRLADGGAVVAVVGQSPIDDASLGAADVSVALDIAGSSTAEWSVQLASDDVRDAAWAIRLAHRCRDEARLGLTLAIAPAAAAVLAVAFALAPPAVAPIASLGGTLARGAASSRAADRRLPGWFHGTNAASGGRHLTARPTEGDTDRSEERGGLEPRFWTSAASPDVRAAAARPGCLHGQARAALDRAASPDHRHIFRLAPSTSPSTAARAGARGRSQIGYATVYRTMKMLAESGIVSERRFGDGHTRYELADEDAHHDHLICLECGSITEFEEPLIEELQERSRRSTASRCGTTSTSSTACAPNAGKIRDSRNADLGEGPTGAGTTQTNVLRSRSKGRGRSPQVTLYASRALS